MTVADVARGAQITERTVRRDIAAGIRSCRLAAHSTLGTCGLREPAGGWRRLLRQSTTQGRTVLQRVLSGRILFTLRRNEISDEVDGYDFEAPTRFDKLFTGIAVERPKDLDPNDRAGLEDIGPEDTHDGDYGRLLERFYGKGVTSPTFASWNQIGAWLKRLDALRRVA